MMVLPEKAFPNGPVPRLGLEPSKSLWLDRISWRNSTCSWFEATDFDLDFLRLFETATQTNPSDMPKILAKIKRFLASEDGPTAVEYAIMLMLIVSVCIVAIQAVGTQTSSMYSDIAADVDTARQAGGF